MTEEKPCEFCGSKDKRPAKPYLVMDRKGEYVPEKGFCCLAYKTNYEYEESRKYR